MQEVETPKRRRRKGQIGRPKINEEKIRLRTIGVRVNFGEMDELQRRADCVGLPLSQWMRQIALGRFVPRPLVPAINRQTYAELGKLAVNLNQLVRAVNEGRSVASLSLLHQLQRNISALRLELMGIKHDRQID